MYLDIAASINKLGKIGVLGTHNTALACVVGRACRASWSADISLPRVMMRKINSEQRWPELRLADQVPEPPQGDRRGAHPDEHQDHARAYPHCAASDGPKVRYSATHRWVPGSLEPN